MFKSIDWSEEFEPNAKCRYNHVIGNSPLGEFLISWKGWKSFPSYELDEIPWNRDPSSGQQENSLSEAKSVCEKLLEDKLKSCLQDSLPNNLQLLKAKW